MNTGFEQEEFQSWVKKEDFFVGLDLSLVEYWTALVPLELKVLHDTYLNLRAGQSGMIREDALKQVVDQFTLHRDLSLLAQQQRFEAEYFKSQEDKEAHVRAVVWMSLELSALSNKGVSKLLNQQLMYMSAEGVVKPTTPLARKILLSRHTAEYETMFNMTASQVFF